MSVTNAISSVIIVGAIIAALSGSSVFLIRQYLWIYSYHFSSNKYFWGFLGDSKNASNVIKKER